MTISKVTDIPVENLVRSFLGAMTQQQVPTCVVFLRNGSEAVVAKNSEQAEATARNILSIRDGAIEAAAAALHAYRFLPPDANKSQEDFEALNRCSIHACAILENEHGKPLPWDELPKEAKEAHRLLAGIVVAAAIAHNPPPASKIIKV